MKIADLFVSLGIKGGDKTMSTLQGTRKGLTDAASAGWEMKAAIVAALYAVEKLFSASGKYGTDLTNMNSALGISMQTMQEYQYAARQTGVSNEEMVGTFKSLQTAMTKTWTGQGAPGGMQWLAQMTGDISNADVHRFQEHPEELFQRIQKAIQLTPDVGYANDRAHTFGLSDDVIAGMRRNAYRPEVFAKAPKYSNREVGQLDQNRAGFANIENAIEMGIGHLNAQHGAKLIAGINQVLPKVLELVQAFTTLSEKAHFFDALGEVFKGWAMIFKEMTDGVVALTKVMDDLNSKDPKKQAEGEQTAKEWAADKGGAVVEMAKAVGDVVVGAAADAVDRATNMGIKPKESPTRKAVQSLQHDIDTNGPITQTTKAARDTALDLAKGLGLTAFGYRPQGGAEATPTPTTTPGGAPAPSEAPSSAPTNAPPKAAEVFHNGPAMTGTAVDDKPIRLQLVPPVSRSAQPRAAAPLPAAAAATPASGDSTVTVNQTMHFEGKTDPKENAHEMKRAVQSAFRQYGALSQGS